MKYFAGIDPDMHTMPIAVVDEEGSLMHVEVFEVDKKITGREAIIAMVKELSNTLHDSTNYSNAKFLASAVEGQELYQFGAGKTKNPKSIMFLATVAGAALMRLNGYGELYMPTPQEWKGSAPKQIHQARVLGAMGWRYEQKADHCIPAQEWLNHYPDVKKAHWKHAVDAIGLAQWAREKYQEINERSMRLQ